MNKFSKAVAASLVAISALSFSAAPSFSQAAAAIELTEFTTQAVAAEMTRLGSLGLSDAALQALIVELVAKIQDSGVSAAGIQAALGTVVSSATGLGLSQGAFQTVVAAVVSVTTAQVEAGAITSAQAASFVSSVASTASGSVSTAFANQLAAVSTALDAGSPTIPAVSASAA